MAVTSASLWAPADGVDYGTILRPVAELAWSGGTGPFDVEFEWDTDLGFASPDLIQLSDTGVTSPYEIDPGADLGPAGTTWYVRARVTDTSDSASSSWQLAEMTWIDTLLQARHHYLLANIGVAFSPIDDPTDWGTSIGGTEAADGFAVLMARHHYLLANVGVGYRFSDEPADGWGIGTWGDGDERLFDRFHYLLANVTTDLPEPYLFRLVPEFGRPGESFRIDGWGLEPHKNWAEGVTASISGWSPSGGAGQFTNGHLPRQSGDERPDVSWVDGTTNDPVFTIDLTTPRLINEVRVWYRLSDPFVSCTVSHSDDGSTFTPIGTMTPAGDGDGQGWATIEAWSSNGDYGTHRYWRLSFTDVNSLGEIEVNRRMTIGTGDIEPHLNDTVTDWLLSVSQQRYDWIVAQAPVTDEPGGDVTVENTFIPAVSNSKFFTFLEPLPAKNTGVLLRVYDKDAVQQLIAIVPDAQDIQFTTMLSAVGAASWSLPLASEFYDVPDLLAHRNVVEIEIDGRVRWWGYISHVQTEWVSTDEGEGESARVTCVQGLSDLGRGLVYPKQWPSLDEPKVWEFVDETAGKIMNDLLDACQARGTLTNIVRNWTDTHDAENEAWADTFTLTFQPGDSLIQVMSTLVALGIDVELTRQFEMKMYNRQGFDLSTLPNGPRLVLGQTITQLTISETFESPATAALISYGDGAYLQYTDPTAIAEYGRFESFAQTSASDATAAQRLAEAALDKAKSPLDQISVEMIADRDEWSTDEMKLVPFVHFGLGDTITVKAPTAGIDADYRVRGISVAAGNVFDPTYVIELNSIRIEKLIEHEIRLKRQLQNTLPIEVASSEPGGSAPREHDHKFPANADLAGTLSDPMVTGFGGVPIDLGPYADGDMWYYDLGDSEWKLVGGTKVTGRVPTIQGDGAVAWQAGGGGGGGTDKIWDLISARPDSPTAWDDEFDGASLDPKWTEHHVGGNPQDIVRNGHMRVLPINYAGSDCGAFLQSIGALTAPVTLEMAVRWYSYNANYLMVGPCFTNGLLDTSQIAWFMPFQAGTLGGVTASMRQGTMTNVGSAAKTERTIPINGGAPLFLRLVWEGGASYSNYVSYDGVEWWNYFVSNPIAINPASPTHLGFAVSNWGTNVGHQAMIEYFRVNPTY